jgi:4-hydroxy-2-oxoheptanedioate aldolase
VDAERARGDGVNTHRIREKLRAGDPTLGCFMGLGSPTVAEVLGHAGFEWLVIETEHNGLDMAQVQELVTAVEGTGAVPFVRVPSLDRVAIQRSLDIGARGIVVPLVRTADEAAAIVSATRFPPVGTRSFGPLRAARYGLDNEDYFRRANEQIVVMLILETREAYEGIREIAAVPGIDALYIGPFDLALSFGLDPLGAATAEVEALIRDAQRVCATSGAALGVPVRTVDELERRRAEGFTLLAFGPDYLLVADAARAAVAAFEAGSSASAP